MYLPLPMISVFVSCGYSKYTICQRHASYIGNEIPNVKKRGIEFWKEKHRFFGYIFSSIPRHPKKNTHPEYDEGGSIISSKPSIMGI